MKAIEDVSAGAAPVTTDLDGTVNGAQTIAQPGQDAEPRSNASWPAGLAVAASQLATSRGWSWPASWPQGSNL